MKADYYRIPERRAALKAEAISWIGTPWCQGSAVKGRLGGVDCVEYLAALHLATGAITERPAFPAYDPDHTIHSPESIILEWLAQPAVRRRVRKVEEGEDPLDGDILLCQVAQAVHHAATRVNSLAFHVSRRRGVFCEALGVRSSILEVRAVYRITE